MRESRWVMLAVVFLTRTSMGFMFQSVASVSPFLVDELTLSYGQIGLLMGLFLLPGVVVALPGGVLGQRYGAKRVALVGLGLMTVGGLGTAWSASFAQACAGRVVSGTGGILLNLLLAKMVADWFSGKEISTAMAVMLTSWPIGIGLALVTLGSVADHWSWRASMLVAAGAAAVGLVLLGALYRNPPGLGDDARADASLKLDLPARAWVLSISVGLCWAALNASFIVVASFGPGFLVAHGASVAEAGSEVSLGIWTSLISIPLGGLIGDRLRRPNLMISTGALAAAVCIALLAILPHPVLWFVVAATVLGLAPGPIMAILPGVLRPEHLATGLGMFYTIFYLGLAVAQPLAGLTRDMSGDPAMPIFFAAALMTITLVGLGLFRWVEQLGEGRAPAPRRV
jgi:MFS family permease